MLTIKRLGLDDAHKLITGAKKKANKIGVPMCIAITDESGNLIAFERMDGANIFSVGLSQDKAFTAAVLGGIGNIKGAVLGGLIIGFTEAFGGAVAQQYDKAFAFGLMVIFILFRPWGILGQKEAKRA